MRLQRHLTEQKVDIEQFWSLVQKKCQPFLKDWLPIQKRYGYIRPLYRGMDVGEWGEKRVRLDRKPESSTREFHYDVDNLMKQKHGIYGRSQTVFVSGDDQQAATYGETYIIFPVGKYRFLWSDKIRDLWVDVRRYDYVRDIKREVDKTMMLDATWNKLTDKKDIDKIRGELEDMFYQRNQEAIRRAVALYKKTDLKKAIESETEIMIECQSYLFLKSNWQNDLEDLIVT